MRTGDENAPFCGAPVAPQRLPDGAHGVDSSRICLALCFHQADLASLIMQASTIDPPSPAVGATLQLRNHSHDRISRSLLALDASIGHNHVTTA
jgi:hypothetical protein